MFRKLRAFLYRDQGENSVMVVLSQFVSLIVAGALAGLVFVLITGGTKVQAENNAQSELRIANRAFVNDVDNAARIYVQDESKLTLSSTKFLKNTAGVFVCRASSWYMGPASDDIRKSLQNNTLMSVFNDVTVYADDTCTGTAVSTQQRVAVSAVTSDSNFNFTNVAGVNIKYSNGIVTNFNGLDPTSSVPAEVTKMANFRTDNAVATWFTNAEMLREVPKVIEARLTAFLPVTQENVASFKATTNEAETELIGNNDNITDPGGEQTRWVPNPVADVLVKRSTTTGAFVGGVREGVQISWGARPAYECSPIQTIKYSWLVTNIRTNKQSSGETTDTNVNVMTGTGGSAQIWNGGNYKIQVAARCNDIDGQSTDRSKLYTLPVPAVVNVGVTANAPQTSHTLTYSSASSDPTVNYAISYAPANIAKANSYTIRDINLINEEAGASDGVYNVKVWSYAPFGTDISAVGTSATTSFTKNGNTVRAGYPDYYEVRAYTVDSPNASGAWSPANYTYNVPAPAAPLINPITQINFDWSSPVCAANTTQEYRAAYSNNIGSAGNPPADATAAKMPAAAIQANRTLTYPAVNQGTRVFTRVEARCITKFTSPKTPPDQTTNGQITTTLSPWSVDGTNVWDRPIIAPAAPGNPRQNYVNYGVGSNAETAWNAVSCPTATVLAYYQGYSEGDGGNTGYTTALSRVVTHTAVSGSHYTWLVKARCESYATGSQMAAESGWSSSAYYTDVRLLGISATRSNTNVVIGTTVYIGGAISCDSGSYGRWSNGPANVVRYNPGSYSFNNTGECVGANNRSSGIGTSNSVGVYWYAPAPDSPGGLSTSATRYCSGGFSLSASWSYTDYADYYYYEYSYQRVNGTTGYGSGTTGSTSVNISNFSDGKFATNFSVSAVNDTGMSNSSSRLIAGGGCQN